jgi:hypothetical protein
MKKPRRTKRLPLRLRRVDLVVIPVRGRRRVYAIGPLTVGCEFWDYFQEVMFAFEKRAKEYAAPLPRHR